MKKYSKLQVLQIITKCAKEYKQVLLGRHFLIVYQKSGQVLYKCISFRDYNYLHLTGVKTKLSARKFFERASSDRLSINDFTVDNYGKVQQKINVLPYLSQLLYNNCMIGDFINSGVWIQADYFVGDTRAVISVGFQQKGELDIPVTLYKKKKKKLSAPTCKVLAIFSKMYNEDKYSNCTYLSKGQVISKFPTEIVQRLELG